MYPCFSTLTKTCRHLSALKTFRLGLVPLDRASGELVTNSSYRNSMRPVERPQDREWTEWVYLLKRLAGKRRIPARFLYNGQIKQFVTILENSLEMRHAAKHQSRPLKDDRNILQLISAGIQVAKILKDAPAMDYLDKLVSNIRHSMLSLPSLLAKTSSACDLAAWRGSPYLQSAKDEGDHDADHRSMFQPSNRCKTAVRRHRRRGSADGTCSRRFRTLREEQDCL